MLRMFLLRSLFVSSAIQFGPRWSRGMFCPSALLYIAHLAGPSLMPGKCQTGHEFGLSVSYSLDSWPMD